MIKKDLIREWLTLMQQDILSASFLFKMKPLPIETICFHCQQAVEKLLKACLQVQDKKIPKTHDLLFLANSASLFNKFDNDLNELNDYSVLVRYPEHPELNNDDAGRALEIAYKIITEIRKEIREIDDIFYEIE